MSDPVQAEPRVLGLIPARGGSKGIPNKNIRPLGGMPLIAHTCQAARRSSIIDQILVSTDSDKIARVALEHGAEVPFLRPDALARDESPTVDVIHHALQWLETNRRVRPEVVVLLQPTTPFRTATDIDESVQRLLTSGADSVVSVCRVPTHFSPEWQFYEEQGNLQLATGEPTERIVPRRQLLRPSYIRNGAVYAFRTEMFLRTGSLYGQHCAAHIMPSSRSVNLDTSDDWAMAEREMRRNPESLLEVRQREAA